MNESDMALSTRYPSSIAFVLENQKVEVIPMKRVNGKLVKPQPWEPAYSQIFVTDMENRFMEALRRKEQECLAHARTVTDLLHKIERLEEQLDWLDEEIRRS